MCDLDLARASASEFQCTLERLDRIDERMALCEDLPVAEVRHHRDEVLGRCRDDRCRHGHLGAALSLVELVALDLDHGEVAARVDAGKLVAARLRVPDRFLKRLAGAVRAPAPVQADAEQAVCDRNGEGRQLGLELDCATRRLGCLAHVPRLVPLQRAQQRDPRMERLPVLDHGPF